MSSEPNSSPAPHLADAPFTPFQEAIRARAIATLENEARQPKPTTRRKIFTALATLVTVLLLGVVIDFGVRIVQRVLELYMEERSNAQAPAQISPDQPYFITVDPPAEAPTTEVPSSSSAPPAD